MLETKIEYVKPTPELVQFIADNMRPADVAEVWASHHHTPLKSLIEGHKLSSKCSVMLVNGVPCVMFGVVPQSALTGLGVAWVLGTSESDKYPREFFHQAQPIIDAMLDECPRLHNWVHAKNRKSVRWLSRVGFTVEEAQPFGPEDEPFHYFHMERGSSDV